MTQAHEEPSSHARRDIIGENAARHKIELPPYVALNTRSFYDYKDQVADYQSFEDLGSAITKARMALFVVTEKINANEREEKRAKTLYERAYRRSYLESMEKTEGAKKMRAALSNEELENQWLKYEQVVGELTRMSYALKSELQTLQTIANNLRQQLRIN